ncbi:MAG: hypothetical protein IKZ47_05445 [Clostridia bacterium]|nr:hypothetical protein [Clostridia bacterium]
MIIIIPLSLYGAYKLLNYLTVEYEYIIVNGSLDLDIIYGKSSRKRLGSFELSDVESIEKYNGETLDKNRYKKIIIACDAKSDEAYKIVFNKDSAVSIAIMTPNEKTRASIVKFVPKYVGNTAFKS